MCTSISLSHTPPTCCQAYTTSVYFWPVSDSIPTCKHPQAEITCLSCHLNTVLAPLLFTGLPDYLCLIILNDQRDARIHVHPLYKNQGRKQWSKFCIGTRNPQGNQSVGNQGSLNIMKKFLKHPCGLGGVISNVWIPWLKACHDAGAHLLILQSLHFQESYLLQSRISENLI